MECLPYFLDLERNTIRPYFACIGMPPHVSFNQLPAAFDEQQLIFRRLIGIALMIGCSSYFSRPWGAGGQERLAFRTQRMIFTAFDKFSISQPTLPIG